MKIISREEAKALGLKRYFTGEPCSNGHICERLTTNWCCVTCKNISSKNSKKKHPETARKNQKIWKEKNRKIWNNYVKEYQQIHRENQKAEYINLIQNIYEEDDPLKGE